MTPTPSCGSARSTRDKMRRFTGEVRNLTIWPAALPRQALEALHKSDADRAASAK